MINLNISSKTANLNNVSAFNRKEKKTERLKSGAT